ncbi:hypothetical protein BH23GEM3_BH23GEM3_26850 [soil metagenome]
MNKPVHPRIHGALDYAVVPFRPIGSNPIAH